MDTPPTSPTRHSYSRAEALAFAQAHLIATYGPPREMDDEQLDRYHERLGLLVDVLTKMFPA